MQRADIPNALTLLRLMLSGLLFIVLSLALEARLPSDAIGAPLRFEPTALGGWLDRQGSWLFDALFWTYVASALTDMLDGYLARRWEVTSAFGRVADPFADKILISGSLILFACMGFEATRLAPWMVVVIIAREYLVTGLRGHLESKGLAFPANAWGKAKMWIQSVHCGALYLLLARPSMFGEHWPLLLSGLAYGAVFTTALSGFIYIRRARLLLIGPKEDVELP